MKGGDHELVDASADQNPDSEVIYSQRRLENESAGRRVVVPAFSLSTIKNKEP